MGRRASFRHPGDTTPEQLKNLGMPQQKFRVRFRNGDVVVVMAHGTEEAKRKAIAYQHKQPGTDSHNAITPGSVTTGG